MISKFRLVSYYKSVNGIWSIIEKISNGLTFMKIHCIVLFGYSLISKQIIVNI